MISKQAKVENLSSSNDWKTNLGKKQWISSKDFPTLHSRRYCRNKKVKENKVNETNSARFYYQITPPNNDKLIAYFNERGFQRSIGGLHQASALPSKW